MRDARAIASAVGGAIRAAAIGLRPDVLEAMVAARHSERSERAGAVLDQLIANAKIAAADRVPLCQDTGTVWVWLEFGVEECIPSDLAERIDEAVAEAYDDAGLRMSVVRDGLLDRTNTGDNTPAFVDITTRPGRGVTAHVMLKGGGSDNASAVFMLAPGAGEQGVIDAVVGQVQDKATSACPPLIVGVGVGGTFDSVGKLAKRALVRPVGEPHPVPEAARFERRLLEAINDTGIGPAGLGGDTTALAVHLNTAPCHIASMPVAVNMGCSAVRSVSVDVG